MFVKPGHRQDDPAVPLIVRGPNKRLLSPQGENVSETTFWHRRVRDGDVVLAEPPAPPAPAPRLAAAVVVVPPVVDPVAARAAADAFVWQPPAAAGQLEHVAGEPLRLTAAEWARLPALDPPSGPAVEGFAVAAAEHERDPAAPLLTRDEYLAEIKP
jgi:hypothetical protein